jgi:hypothetical protein
VDVIVGGWSKPNPRESHKFFDCDYWVCTCGYGEHAAPNERVLSPQCLHCGAWMRVLERHWHKRAGSP